MSPSDTAGRSDGAGPVEAGPVVAGPVPEPSRLSPGALEAVLLVAEEPVPVAVLVDVLAAPADEVLAALELLAAELDTRAGGIELRVTEAGWRLHTRPEHVDVVERFLREGQRVRLTQAGLEALAVVAYSQPTTRAHVSSVRGVASDGVLRTLVVRGLVEEAGSDPATGAATYRTSELFLERLGIASLTDLPALAPHLPDPDPPDPDPPDLDAPDLDAPDLDPRDLT